MRGFLSHKKLPGFSIAEVVLSSFLLTTGIISIVALFSVAHQSGYDTQKLIVASELAQEGVEIVRNIRDNNIATKVETGNSSYDVFTGFPNGSNQRCTGNYDSTSLSCSGPSFRLYTNNTGLYQHSGGTASQFYRVLKIDHNSGSDNARIQSFVSWQDPGSNLNGNTATSWCTPYNKCVYTELYLSAWR